MAYENLSSSEFLDSSVDTTVKEAPPISAFEVTQSETEIIARKALRSAEAAKASKIKLEAQIKEVETTLTALQPDILKARRDVAIAKKLQRVRRTPDEEIAAMEELAATLEVEADELNDQLIGLQEQVNALTEAQQRALLVQRVGGFEFNLGTTRPALTLQLLSNLRRNLVYKQRYLEDAVSAKSTAIRDRAELVNYSNGIAGFASESDRDHDALEDLEAELAEVYSLQEVTGLLYDKVLPLLPEQQQGLLKWSPKDQITIQSVRREALEKSAERAEIEAEIAARRAAEKAAIQDAARGRRIRTA